MGSFFSIKDKIDESHRSSLVYGFKIPGLQTDSFHYVGETSVRFETRVYEHGHTDRNSAIYKNSREGNYSVSKTDFCILASGYNKWLDRRLCEALYVKDNKPILNAQKNSHKLELFS